MALVGRVPSDPSIQFNKVKDIYVLTYFCQQLHNTNFKNAINSLIFAGKDGLTLMTLLPM